MDHDYNEYETTYETVNNEWNTFLSAFVHVKIPNECKRVGGCITTQNLYGRNITH